MGVSRHNDGLAGGPPKYFAFVEAQSGVLLVGSCVRGISRSTDGGATWTPVGHLDHVSVNTLALDPGGALLAATSGGLWRSEDGRDSWQQLDDVPRYAVLADAPSIRGPDGVTTYRLLRLADGRALAGTDGHGVWIDDGGTWGRLGSGPAIVYSLAVTAGGALLAGTRGQGVMRSEDGATWSSSSAGLADVYVHCLVELADGTMLAGTGQGISRSSDDGQSWHPYASELRGHRIFSLLELADGRIAAGSYTHMWLGAGERWQLVDPGLTPDEAWCVGAGPDGELYAGAKPGLLRSDDRGDRWHQVSSDSGILALTFTSSGQMLYGGDAGVRAGPDWTPLGNLGHRTMTLLETTPGTVLAGTLSDGMHRYREGTWAPVPHGPPHWQVYRIIRSATGRLLAGTGAIIDGAKVGGVFTSDDGGETWVETLSGRSYYGLAQTSDGTVYAGGRRCYISRSGDDGDSWEPCPLPHGREAKMYTLFVDRADGLFLGSGGQLLRSDDGAQTWQVLDDGIDGLSIYDLCQTDDGLLAAATTGGVVVSDDGGDSWRAGEVV